MDDEVQRALPRDAPSFHRRQASHFRALAHAATTRGLKARLIEQAEEHEQRAELLEQPGLHLAEPEQ